MMHFTCTYCEKPINSVTIIIDKTHFLHQGCEEAFKKKENVIKKWEDSGLLDGLKSMDKMNPEQAKIIEQTFGCCKSEIINED